MEEYEQISLSDDTNSNENQYEDRLQTSICENGENIPTDTLIEYCHSCWVYILTCVYPREVEYL